MDQFGLRFVMREFCRPQPTTQNANSLTQQMKTSQRGRGRRGQETWLQTPFWPQSIRSSSPLPSRFWSCCPGARSSSIWISSHAVNPRERERHGDPVRLSGSERETFFPTPPPHTFLHSLYRKRNSLRCLWKTYGEKKVMGNITTALSNAVLTSDLWAQLLSTDWWYVRIAKSKSLSQKPK